MTAGYPVYYTCFLVFPHWDCHILMGFSASAGPHIFLCSLVRSYSYARSFVNTTFSLSLYPTIPSHSYSFISPAVCPHSRTPRPRLHVLLRCMPLQARRPHPIPFKRTNKLPWFVCTTKGLRTSERTLRFVCSPTRKKVIRLESWFFVVAVGAGGGVGGGGWWRRARSPGRRCVTGLQKVHLGP